MEHATPAVLRTVDANRVSSRGHPTRVKALVVPHSNNIFLETTLLSQTQSSSHYADTILGTDQSRNC
jgi:hypothetical protein